LICGVRNSGKTFTALEILNLLLKESNIKKFHLVLLVYRFEQNDAYSFLQDYEEGKRKDGKVCYIYPKFKDSLLAAICARELKDESSDLCVFIDNAVASDSLSLSRSRFLGDLRRCVVILVSHSISSQVAGAQQGVLSTFTRQQASFAILMRCGNADLLE